MKFKKGDKVIDIHTKQTFTIRDILLNPMHPIDLVDENDDRNKVYYMYEVPSFFSEERLMIDIHWAREEKLKELGI